MKELKITEKLWYMSDTPESSIVNKTSKRVPHPLEEAIAEAISSGYFIKEMDFVKVIPSDKREASFESPAVMLYNPENNLYAAIVQTPKRPAFGRIYQIVNYSI